VDSKALIKLYRRGFLPGPNESEEAFLQRVEMCEEIAKDPQRALRNLPLSDFDLCTEPLGLVEPLNFTFDTLLTVRSDKRLPFWEGAATWSFELEGGGQLPILQLRKNRSYMSLEEIVSHEAVHILRTAFDEMRFEEILAYRTSKKGWRRYFGPLFRRPRESLIFALLTLGAFALEVILLALFPFAVWAVYLFIFPLSYVSFLLLRLVRDQRIFSRCLSKLKRRFKEHDSEELALFFTDREIVEGAIKMGGDLRSSLFRYLINDV